MTEHHRVKVRRHDDTAVVRFRDRKLINMHDILELSEELFQIAAGNVRGMILDFEDVQFVSSSALNKLVLLERKLKSRGGRMAVANLSPVVGEVFTMTSLDKVFSVRDSVEEALAELAQPAAPPDAKRPAS